MDWTYDPTDNAYTLISGEIRCRVWLTTLGTWASVIMHHGISTAAYNFATPDEAKSWCEAQAHSCAPITTGVQPDEEYFDATPHADHENTSA